MTSCKVPAPDSASASASGQNMRVLQSPIRLKKMATWQKETSPIMRLNRTWTKLRN